MCSLKSISLLNYILILISLTSHIIAVNTKGVPVLIWGNQGYLSNPIELQSHSLLDQISEQTFAEDIIKKAKKSDATLVTIVQNELSLEDFSTANKNELKTLDKILKTYPSYFLANVENPLNAIEESDDNITKIESIDNLLIKPENKIVLIKLPANNGLKENDKLIGNIVDRLKLTKNEKLVVMLTAKINSYSEEELHRISRHILQNSVPKSKPKAIDGHLVNYENCIYLFTNGGKITVSVTKRENTDPDFTVSGDLAAVPSSVTGSCPQFDEKEKSSLGKLTLEYENVEKVGKLVITFSIAISKRESWWNVKQISTTITNKKGHWSIQLDSDLIQAENGFSFSCGDLILRDANKSDEEALDFVKIRLNFNRFQLQPFKLKSLKTFADSFDCSTLFTIPLWMGLITVLFFCFLLLIGVYFLNQIKTMDRFENPKGKTITVSATD